MLYLASGVLCVGSSENQLEEFGRVSFACGKSEVIFFLLLSSYSKKTPTSKVGDELRLLPA